MYASCLSMYQYVRIYTCMRSPHWGQNIRRLVIYSFVICLQHTYTVYLLDWSVFYLQFCWAFAVSPEHIFIAFTLVSFMAAQSTFVCCAVCYRLRLNHLTQLLFSAHFAFAVNCLETELVWMREGGWRRVTHTHVRLNWTRKIIISMGKRRPNHSKHTLAVCEHEHHSIGIHQHSPAVERKFVLDYIHVVFLRCVFTVWLLYTVDYYYVCLFFSSCRSLPLSCPNTVPRLYILIYFNSILSPYARRKFRLMMTN